MLVCERCEMVSDDPMDVRFGYCPTCKDFTSDPTDFVIESLMPEEERTAFRARVMEAMQHRFNHAAPIRILTDEEREQMHQQNLAALRYEERVALTLIRPAPPPPWWRRAWRWLIGSPRA